MRKISFALTATFLLLASGLAWAHGGNVHVMGTIKAVAANHLEVKTRDGKIVSVPLVKTTHYLKGKQKAGLKDVRVGDRVVVEVVKGGAAEEVRLPAETTAKPAAKPAAAQDSPKAKG